MFTGIVEAVAHITQRTDDTLVIERPADFSDVQTGSSVSVAGACLTVVSCDDQSLTCNVVPETLDKTKLGTLTAGDSVNLERAMRADGRFEGHVVQGHVEGVGTVAQFIRESKNQLTVELPEELLQLVVPKGSITLDGVSLTVAAIDGRMCSVALIPHTLEHTTLGALQVGDPVNVETDVIGRYVQKMTQETNNE